MVLEFNKDEQIDVEIALSAEQLAEKYEGKLDAEMSGATFEVVSRIMRALVNQRITVPGTFVGWAPIETMPSFAARRRRRRSAARTSRRPASCIRWRKASCR